MNHQYGFSLLELMCVLAILSALAYAGSAHVLSISQTSQSQQALKASVQALSDALRQARQLAVVSGKTSFLCGGVACDGDWSSGFQLYQQDKTYQKIPFAEDVSVSWRGFPSQKKHIEFRPNGLSGYQNGTFEFCVGIWKRVLVLNQSGRFYTSQPNANGEGGCS